MKIDIVVHGRFHAFHLARELLLRGHDVVLYTNYPKSIVARYGIPAAQVVTNITHGVCARLITRLAKWLPRFDPEPLLLRWFGKWAAAAVRHDADCVHAFSGVALEVFSHAGAGSARLLMRGSAHIREQHRLLLEEEVRCGHRVEKPSEWMVAREEAEYAVSDRIVVLSGFAFESFRANGVPASKLALVPLGATLSGFRAPADVAAARMARVLAGEPLRILMVGSFSPRKGALDFITVAADSSLGDFRFVGDIARENRWLQTSAGDSIEFVDRVPERELPAQYHWADIFVFPTIEDGYAMVIAQAMAAGLPVIATQNCAGPDMVSEGCTGWIVPIRRPDLMAQRLQWCSDNRAGFAAVCRQAHESVTVRDWSAVACDFEQLAAGTQGS
ncbi:MAG: glycosyltransferase family 4 protein [Pseudomonadota bacterium]